MAERITLNYENSIDFLIQFTEVAQKHGSFNLQEADLLKKAIDSVKNIPSESLISKTDAQTLLIQAVAKGQSKGAYTLSDASTIYNICTFLSREPQPQQPQPQQLETIRESTKEQDVEEDDELFDLSAPVPLKTTRV